MILQSATTDILLAIISRKRSSVFDLGFVFASVVMWMVVVQVDVLVVLGVGLCYVGVHLM